MVSLDDIAALGIVGGIGLVAWTFLSGREGRIAEEPGQMDPTPSERSTSVSTSPTPMQTASQTEPTRTVTVADEPTVTIDPASTDPQRARVTSTSPALTSRTGGDTGTRDVSLQDQPKNDAAKSLDVPVHSFTA